MLSSDLLEWEECTPAHKQAIRLLAEQSPLTFMRIFFQLNQGMKFQVNWHHRLMDHAVAKVFSGEWQNVVFNMPPGGTKTEYWSIHLPAYCFTKFPRTRILNTSYSKGLVEENSNRVKSIIKGSEYQELWPSAIGKDQVDNWTIQDADGKNRHQMFSRSAGGQITGVRGGYMGEEFSGWILLDDFLKPDDAWSKVKRGRSNQLITNTLRSRKACPTTPVLCIQQRLHTDDTSGFLLSGGMGLDFEQVMVPALVTEEYIRQLPDEIREHALPLLQEEFIERGGVRYWSYWPAKENVHDLAALWDRDDYTFLSQYQQNPRALTGGLIDPDWFLTYEQLPFMQWRAVFVDTAQKTGEKNDYSVFLYCGLGVDGNLYIIDMERGKYEAWRLEEVAQEVWQRWMPWDQYRPAALRSMFIEDKASGTGLIQTIKQKVKSMMVTPIPRSVDKVIRAMDTIPWLKSGRVRIPARFREDGSPIDGVYDHRGQRIASNDWTAALLAEAGDFTADDSHEHDDIMDTVFDAVAHMLISPASTGFKSWL